MVCKNRTQIIIIIIIIIINLHFLPTVTHDTLSLISNATSQTSNNFTLYFVTNYEFWFCR